MVGVSETVNGDPSGTHERRKLIADFCKMIGGRVGAVASGACNAPGLSPRERQTLQHLLAGDSEKQVARKLGIDPHTVHVHVKRLYKHFEVSSRGELLARCLASPPTPTRPG